jgi:pyruvate,water dikinase
MPHAEGPGAQGEASNALHGRSAPDATWSSINLAEAVPGVMTPLCASAWVPASELGLREPFFAMGALPSSRVGVPAQESDRITNAFFGRMAVRVDFLCEMGDLIPGQSGEALSRDFFGFVPPNYQSHPSNRRLGAIAARYPRTLLGIAKRIERLRAETDVWWRREIAAIAGYDLARTQRLAADARDRFTENLAAQAVISACAIQPVQEQLTTLCTAAGVDPAVLLRGASHEEGVVLADLWAVSRGGSTLDEFLRKHGYHGPGEGEVETRVWRENPDPVRRIVAQYTAKPDSESPSANAAEHRRQRDAAQRSLMSAAGGPLGRIRAELVLRLARRFIPLRGTGKVSYLQSLDVLRAAARHLGAVLVPTGRLGDPEDAFYLTADELSGSTLTDQAVDLAELVAQRRAIRTRYQSLTAPMAWTGQPEAQPLATAPDDTSSLSGIGVCSGVAEGRAVVVLDPAEAEIEEGDILIAHTTDPAWVSLMFLSGALVVDIGGMMSHAAVVARELGIPCVMNTGHGTSVLRTGDTIRVDGAAGTVDVLTRADASSVVR